MADEKKVRTIYAGDVDEWIGTGLLGLLGLTLVAALVFVVAAIASSARASGSPDYCMVLLGTESGVAPTYRLWAHRPWSGDKQLGVFQTFADAAAASERIACPFRSTP